jgi:hypothetical protein
MLCLRTWVDAPNTRYSHWKIDYSGVNRISDRRSAAADRLSIAGLKCSKFLAPKFSCICS